MLFFLKLVIHSIKFAIGAVSLDSTLVDVHPDVPKEYEKEIVRLKIYCVKNTSSIGAIEHPAVKIKILFS
jgi:hypothetical protein